MDASLHRRRLLELAALALASVLLPRRAAALPEVQERSADGTAPTPPAARHAYGALGDALTAAQERGHALFVFIVPREHTLTFRSQIVASFLLGASDAALAELAACEVAFASETQLALAFPELKEFLRGEPLGWLVELDGSAARAVGQGVVLPPEGARPRGWQARSRALRSWAAPLEQDLHAAYGLDHLLRSERARLERLCLLQPDVIALERLCEQGRTWSTRQLALAPAWALAAARAPSAAACRARQVDHRLARSMRAGLETPRGAHWTLNARGFPELAFGGGAGEPTGGCGMGSLPRSSRRFVAAYARADAPPGIFMQP